MSTAGEADPRPEYRGDSGGDPLIEHRVSGERVYTGALLDVRHDDSLAGAQGNAAAAFRIDAHPFPELRGLRIEPAEGHETELAAGSTLRIEHLHA